MPAELTAAPLPEGAEYLWQWFRELDAARSSSGYALEPISHAEILAWAGLSGHRPTPFETGCLRAMDGAFLAHQAEQARKRRKK